MASILQSRITLWGFSGNGVYRNDLLDEFADFHNLQTMVAAYMKMSDADLGLMP